MADNILNPKVKQTLLSILQRDNIQISYTEDHGVCKYEIHDQQPIFECWYMKSYGDYSVICLEIYNPNTRQMEAISYYQNMPNIYNRLTENEKSVIDLIEKVEQRYLVVPELSPRDSNVLVFLKQFVR